MLAIGSHASYLGSYIPAEAIVYFYFVRAVKHYTLDRIFSRVNLDLLIIRL